MYVVGIVVIAWLFVTLLMAVAEATSPSGSLMGALITFTLYGALPLSIVVYLLTAPMRRMLRREKEQREEAAVKQTVQEQAVLQGAAPTVATDNAPKP